MKFRNLNADEIDVKVGSVTSKGYTLLLYKNARVDMAILDETVGAENWQNKFYEVCGNLYCSVGINVNYNKPNAEPYWVWKDDCGVESDFGDKEKGQASDARKRAGFAWGIGRELYTSPFIFIPCETTKDGNSYKITKYEDKVRSMKMRVEKVTYTDDNTIKDLVIVDNNGEIAFSNDKKQSTAQKSTTNSGEVVGGSFKFSGGKYKGYTIDEVFDLNKGYLDWCLTSDNVGEELKNNIKKFIIDRGLEND